ncbi:MAG: hypothetical protein HEEMFOPI_00637 [Holosporales bacterium]
MRASARAASATPATAIETEEEIKKRIHEQAIATFERRRVKLRDVACRINEIFKADPDARSIFFRQGGSHLVANGTSPTKGPLTFVLPHGGDGTISSAIVREFLIRLIHLSPQRSVS